MTRTNREVYHFFCLIHRVRAGRAQGGADGQRALAHLTRQLLEDMSTPVGFEPTQGDPIGLAGRRLSHSAKVSSGCVLCGV